MSATGRGLTPEPGRLYTLAEVIEAYGLEEVADRRAAWPLSERVLAAAELACRARPCLPDPHAEPEVAR